MRIKMVNGVPTPMPAEEEAARDAEEAAWLAGQAARDAEAARVASLDTAIKNDSVLQNLKGMTAAQFDAWWDNNVTSAAQVIAILKRLVKIVIRRLL